MGAIAGGFEVKAFLFLGIASLSCVALASSRGYDSRARRGLTDVVAEDFDVIPLVAVPITDFNANAIVDSKGGKNKKKPAGGKGGAQNTAGGGTVFNVNSYGAKADDKTDNAQSFIKAWVAACKSGGSARLLIPTGTYRAGPVVFQGPCSGPLTVEVQGIIKATTDISEYTSPEWFAFERINGLTLFGGGTFDGQGAAVWKYNDCKKNKGCQLLPASIKFAGVSNAVVHDITSLNSKSFHTHVNGCQNFKAFNLKITAPGDSPNTDGMHISTSSHVDVSSSVIGTGDDCISVGQGVSQLTVSNITCGPGHGISVGSLGKYPHEQDVSGITVSGCTLKGTTNGVRIKTWPGSAPSKASGIIFQNIIMDTVKNPIIIDQKYGSSSSAPSKVAISDVHFRSIRGTSTTPVAVSLVCSSALPCNGVELADIDLSFNGKSASASCSNAHVKASGKQNPACA